jgi:chemotaxis regulatin CheY-phosphate phosphatase CheZ
MTTRTQAGTGRSAKPATQSRRAPAPTKAAKAAPATGQVLKELKALAKELNKAAKGLGKRNASDPKAIAEILGNVERMMSEAADKSLAEAESAKQVIGGVQDSLGKDWSRKEIENGLAAIGGNLTNIIVAQEFQDIAGQALRKAMKALVGAIVVEASTTEDRKLSQNEVDNLLKGLMP